MEGVVILITDTGGWVVISNAVPSLRNGKRSTCRLWI